MAKNFHEIRDPISNFVKLDSDERDVLNSVPVQRLRYIHQLAFTYLVYPGATHRRFEHSLGVMELASRVFDIITDEKNNQYCNDIFPQKDQLTYWRRVLRMASLCHDIGHMPFSHAAEDLLPDGMTHEIVTYNLIKSPEMEAIWSNITPPLRSEDIAKIAVGPKDLKGKKFSTWEAILSEIITGNAFGVDRIDYLLRDSLHSGVAYGKFDHYRLIDTLKVLPKDYEDSKEPTLGIEEGGLHSAEALILARHFMFTQLYCHHVRRIYDIHLKDFLKSWLQNGKYSNNLQKHLRLTDAEILTEIRKAYHDDGHPGHEPAKCILTRNHFRLLYKKNPEDTKINPGASKAIYDATRDKFGDEFVRLDDYRKGSGIINFPVLTSDNKILSSWMLSELLSTIPSVSVSFVFIAPHLRDEATKWLDKNRTELVKAITEEETE